MNNFHFFGLGFGLFSNAHLLDVGEDVKRERERGTHHVFMGSDISNEGDGQIVQVPTAKLAFTILEMEDKLFVIMKLTWLKKLST